MKRRALILSLFAVTALSAGCDNLSSTPKAGSSADVGQALPSAIAGPPETLGMPRRMQQPARVYAVRTGVNVHLFSKDRWRGHVVTLYYVPERNTVRDATHYDLSSTSELQKIGSAVIQTDGTWSTVWRVGGQPLPKLFFVLGRSDEGQIGLGKLQHTPGPA